MRRSLAVAVLLLFVSVAAFAAFDVSQIPGIGGNGSSGTPWTGWETAVNGLNPDSAIYFPAGHYQQASKITIQNGWRIFGDGKKASFITSTFSGTAFQTAGTINSIAEINASIENLGIKNTNTSNNGSGVLVVAGAMFRMIGVEVQNFKFGVTLLQAEIVTIDLCDIFNESANNGMAGIWIVNDGSYNTSNADQNYSTASSGISNVIAIRGCQIGMTSGKIGLIDDGGYSHTVEDTNFQGGTHAMWLCAASNVRIARTHCENQSSSIAKVTNLGGVSGTTIGGSAGVSFEENFMSAATGQKCLDFAVGASPVLLLKNLFSSTVTAVTGLSASYTAINAGSINLSGQPTFDTDLALDVYGDLNTNRDVRIKTAGKGLYVATGTNARQGTATLVGGTVTVSNTSIQSTDRIYLQRKTVGGTPGFESYTINAGVGFTINSGAADTSTFNWLIVGQ